MTENKGHTATKSGGLLYSVSYKKRLLHGAGSFLLSEMEAQEKIFFDCFVAIPERKRAIGAYTDILFLVLVLLKTHRECKKEFRLLLGHIQVFIVHFEEHGKKYSEEEVVLLTGCANLLNEIQSMINFQNIQKDMLDELLEYNKH